MNLETARKVVELVGMSEFTSRYYLETNCVVVRLNHEVEVFFSTPDDEDYPTIVGGIYYTENQEFKDYFTTEGLYTKIHNDCEDPEIISKAIIKICREWVREPSNYDNIDRSKDKNFTQREWFLDKIYEWTGNHLSHEDLKDFILTLVMDHDFNSSIWRIVSQEIRILEENIWEERTKENNV